MLIGAIGLTSGILNTHHASGQSQLQIPPMPFYPHDLTPGPPHGNMATEAVNMTLIAYARTTEAVRLSLPTPTNPQIIDLSPELPDWQKDEVRVQHSDGTIVQYNIGPANIQTPDLSSAIVTKLNLQPGDKIIYSVNLGWLNEMAPPTATVTFTPALAKPTSTQSTTIYPYPINTPAPPQ